MKTIKFPRHLFSLLVTACAGLALLSACQVLTVSTIEPTPVPPTETVLPTQPPTDVLVVVATETPVEETGSITLDASGVTQDLLIETVPAVLASAGGPWWEAAPEHYRITLLNYPVSSHKLTAQVLVYPVADFAAVNEAAAMAAADLQALLETRQAGDQLPFLPLRNESQVMHPQVQYLYLQNGTGVRFLTQYNQGPLPINNFELFYTFQGLTNDGKYYIAAVLPVTHPELPDSQQLTEQQVAEISEFPAYMTKTVAWLDQQPAGSFTPDLAKLDALIQSIEVK